MKDMKEKIEQLRQVIRAARCEIPADTIVSGGTLVNVMTGECYQADISIFGDTIVGVGEGEPHKGPLTTIIDATGYYLTPGLIDGHIHSECSKMSITSYSKAVVPHGTTSMISGLDEYTVVSGLDGLREIFEEVKGVPLRVFWGAPFRTPYTVPESTVAFNFNAQAHSVVQKWPECYGVWETIREYVNDGDEDTLAAVVQARENRLPVFGCAPMARGKELDAYLCTGARMDHESYDHEEALEKMRKGMHMILRESSVTHFLEENIKVITQVNPALARRVSFCTDDVTASDVLKRGHLDNAVRMAIRAGMDPITAIQMGTINSAEAYRIDHIVGSITPGRKADILLIDRPESFQVQKVISGGKLIAENGKLNYDLKPPKRSPLLSSKLKCKPTTKEDFQYRVSIRNGTAKVLSMDVKSAFVRKRRDVELKVVNGIVQPDPQNDVAMVSVLERFGRNGNKSLAFCSGWHLKSGAMASSCAPDDNNIVVMGVDAGDMSAAVNYLIEQGGGQVLVKDGQIVQFLPLPIGGIVSDEEPEEISRKEREVNRAASELGCDLEEPLMFMFFLPITAVPDYAITDGGPVDVNQTAYFDPILELTEQ